MIGKRLGLVFWAILIFFAYIAFQRANMTVEEKRVAEFSRVFNETKNFYLLDNILTPEEKDKVLLSLGNDSKEEKEIIFDNLLKEKEGEIAAIGQYQKDEWKKEYEEDQKIRNFLKKTVNFPKTWLFRFLFSIMIISFGLFYILIPQRKK